MDFKIKIKKDSAAAKMFKAFMAEKAAFRKAAETGKIAEYAKNKPGKFANPL